MIHVSASQLETFSLCRRKWAFQYIDGIRPPDSPSAANGSAYHAIAEHYLLHGECLFSRPPHYDGAEPPAGWRTVGEWLAPAIPYLPRPGAVEVEQDMAFPGKGHGLPIRLPDGHTTLAFVKGRIDMRAPGWIGDHKTTSDQKWAKTPQALENDTQAIIYALSEILRLSLDSVTLRWVYTRTKGTPHAWPVETTITRDHANSVFQKKILPVINDVVKHRKTFTSANDVEPSPDACSAFGGCPHIDRCKLSAAERFAANMRISPITPAQENNMPLPAALAAELANGTAQPIAPPAPALAPHAGLPEAAREHWAAYTPEQQAQWLAAFPAPAPVAPPAPPAPPAPVAPPVAAAPVAPPPAPPVAAAPVAPPPAPPVAAAPVAPPPAPAPLVEPAKRGRGRPPVDHAIKASLIGFWQSAYCAGIAAGKNSEECVEIANRALADFEARTA